MADAALHSQGKNMETITLNTSGLSVRIWRGKPVRRMHVMVKPIGPLCNLDCTYCYDLSKQELLSSPGEKRISICWKMSAGLEF